MKRFSLRHVLAIKLAGVALGLTGLSSFSWACVVFFGPDLWVFYSLFLPGASGIVRTFTHFETNQPEVWLTIDDGPDEHDTPRLLDLLDHHGARATFFLIGERAARHPALVSEIARRGHEIGHHTHTHAGAWFWCAPPHSLGNELDAACRPLTPPEGLRPRRFRAPVGIKNLFLARALARRNLVHVGWSIRSFDSFSRDPEATAERVLGQVCAGAIVLMHEGPSLHDRVRVNAVSLVIAGLGAQGFRCVIPTDDQLRTGGRADHPPRSPSAVLANRQE